MTTTTLPLLSDRIDRAFEEWSRAICVDFIDNGDPADYGAYAAILTCTWLTMAHPELWAFVCRESTDATDRIQGDQDTQELLDILRRHGVEVRG